MTIPLQGTLARPLKLSGVGLHSGCLVNCHIIPAGPNTGIIFKRIDTEDSIPVKADPFNITDTRLCTAIGSGTSKVSTIEHLMSAFVGLGIDNAYIEIDNEEVPILDGSAAPFYDQLSVVGVQAQNAPRKMYVSKKPFELKVGSSLIRIEPYHELRFECEIDFTEVSKAIGKQKLGVSYSEKLFTQICEARTFCHVDDVTKMREMGLGRGGSLDNAVVVDDNKVMNGEGLRYTDEFVRHKLLDCIGDLALMGGRFQGKITLVRPGHSLHAEFTKAAMMNLREYFEVSYGVENTAVPGMESNLKLALAVNNT
ncbi:UDP-3-O-acyl-N-acetylglucosamine deacetylase [bacterium]|nr:UDP-3-O-acyl-N-acetylglucosamine deacetylase [bacterium]